MFPAHAEVVHKWIDADGVTHYSDTAPVSSTTQVLVIGIPARNLVKTDVDTNYYSIKNQWQRLYKERLEKQKLELEKARQKAALEAATPQVVYIKESHEKQYAIGYPGSFHRRYGRNRWHKKHKHHYGYSRNRYYRGKTPIGLHAGRLELGSYRLSQ
ncbi:MAG: DUF4124 domain-containing protein [Gammaproteobacteria bacterium]|nr:DUF4124 domain-containing protein [Gammaproteobacteria bacterium]MDH3856909.1 DUF4124 domain-containing protein [Gammaproteobacteria bacterium]